jgi:hypothetical protein
LRVLRPGGDEIEAYHCILFALLLDTKLLCTPYSVPGISNMLEFFDFGKKNQIFCLDFKKGFWAAGGVNIIIFF